MERLTIWLTKSIFFREHTPRTTLIRPAGQRATYSITAEIEWIIRLSLPARKLDKFVSSDVCSNRNAVRATKEKQTQITQPNSNGEDAAALQKHCLYDKTSKPRKKASPTQLTTCLRFQQLKPRCETETSMEN